MWSRDVALRLLSNQDFQALFDDPDSPVQQEIARLTQQSLDPHLDDPTKSLRVRSKRFGMLSVYETVKLQANEPSIPEVEKQLEQRRPGSKYLSRRLRG